MKDPVGVWAGGWVLGGCLPHRISVSLQEASLFLGLPCVSRPRGTFACRAPEAPSTVVSGQQGGCSLGALGPESAAVPGGVLDGCPMGPPVLCLQLTVEAAVGSRGESDTGVHVTVIQVACPTNEGCCGEG